MKKYFTVSSVAVIALNLIGVDTKADETPARITEYVVTATRAPANIESLPMAMGVIDRSALANGQPQILLSESLPRIAGVIAHNRQNYAQDLQLSIRGFGARSTFGVRGLRIYVDDIPATMADGQGQLSHIDLNSVGRIEILRGPFSSLYGNSSGGVIAIFSEQPARGDQLEVASDSGSYDTRRQAVKISGAHSAVNYLFDAAHFESDGYRDHSAVERTNVNAKLGVAVDSKSVLKMVFNAVDMPTTQDPLGLTRAQLAHDRQQAGSNAELFDTRKSVRQQQIGSSYQRELNDTDTLHTMFYGGQRSTVQYQSTPVASQLSPASAGAVIDLDRVYWGTDWHWTHNGDELFGAPWQLTVGFNYDRLDEARRGYQNFMGAELGIKGALRRDESNNVVDIDQYLQWQWHPLDNLDIDAGIRNSHVQIDSRDHYIVSGNGDDSGSVDYRATTPVLGISWRIVDDLRLYAAYGKGFETPTLNELAYRSVSGSNTGLNFALDPARSEHSELGMKFRNARGGFDLALFHVVTHNEISVAANANGRAVYQNVGATQRDGVELNVDARWHYGFGTVLSYTLQRAKYATAFFSCPGVPCATPQLIDAGRYMPGIPQSTLFGEITWRHAASGFDTGLELRSESRLYVSDQNNDSTAGYTIVNWRGGFSQKISAWQLSEFLRIENVADKKYVGSVIVNESNARYFEPANERTIFIGLKAKRVF